MILHAEKLGFITPFFNIKVYIPELADKLLAISLKGLDSFMEQLNIKWSIVQKLQNKY